VPDVKTPPAERRPTLREERAALTRRRILDAARRLFFRDGYAATTLKAIAAEAGVAVQTVYAVYGSKPAILAELRALVVSLPEADASVQAALAETTLGGRIRLFAASIRARWETGGDIVAVNQDAAMVDRQIRDEVEKTLERRRAGIRWFVGSLEEVVEGIDVDRAAAVVDALTLYDVYAALVLAHGWTVDAYEAWLAKQLTDAVGRCVGSTRPGTTRTRSS
jgi:AcrR family transcriptional regulator